jgi:DNA invertase Pin-like site-specific DNA recombinase
MAEGSFIAYYRVSTEKQGRSGLGLEAQQHSVEEFLNGGNWRLVAAYTEVESGRKVARPELAKALAACRAHKATLIVAKFDRLARNVAFIANLMEAGVDFVAADMPMANRLTVHVLAAVAEHEAKMISERTKAALAASKARGTKLGGARGYVPSDADRASGLATRRNQAARRVSDLAPIVGEIRAAGILSARGIAAELTRRRIPTPRGLSTWSAVQVQRLAI